MWLGLVSCGLVCVFCSGFASVWSAFVWDDMRLLRLVWLGCLPLSVWFEGLV